MPEILLGHLHHVSLASVLQLAEGESFSGWIRIGEKSKMGFSNGNITQASIGDLVGVAAVREQFLIKSARFVLDKGQPVDGPALGHVMSLVMDGCRIADEWHRLCPMVLDVVEVDGVALQPDVHGVVDGLDGSRCVFEIAMKVGARGSGVVDPLLMLLENGNLAEVADPKHELVDDWFFQSGDQSVDAPAPTPAPSNRPIPEYYDALDTGRVALKIREFATAEAAFLDALLARPEDRIATQNLRRTRQLRDLELS